MRLAIVFPLLLAAILWCRSSIAEPPPVERPSERWDRAVCLVEEGGQAAEAKSRQAGAAFLVAHSDRLMLFTAAHVARFSTAKTRLVFRDPAGDSHWIRLGGLVAATGDPWRHHRQADVAVMQIDGPNIPEKHLRSLNALAFPAEDSLRLDPPGRTSAIEITGFPMLLGVAPTVSPLVMLGHVASRPSELEASWGQEEILFTYPVVGAGCSGGPVFLNQQDPAEATVVGMCIGFYQDKHGFKLTKVAGRLRDAGQSGMMSKDS